MPNRGPTFPERLCLVNPVNLAHPLARGCVRWWVRSMGKGLYWPDVMEQSVRSEGVLTDMTPAAWYADEARSRNRNQNLNNGLRFVGGNSNRVEVPTFNGHGRPEGISPGSITISCWTYLYSLNASRDDRFLSKANGGAAANHDWMIGQQQSAGINQYRARIGRNDLTLYTGPDPQSIRPTSNLNRWLHIAATLDGPTKVMAIYINGDFANSVVGSSEVADSSHPVYIGNHPTSTGNAPDGMIDDVRVWDRALNDIDIKHVYENSLDGYRDLLRVQTLRWFFDINQQTEVTWSPPDASTDPSVPANWVGGVLPSPTDIVVFDGAASNNDCNLTGTTEWRGVKYVSNYAGTLSLGANVLTLGDAGYDASTDATSAGLSFGTGILGCQGDFLFDSIGNITVGSGRLALTETTDTTIRGNAQLLPELEIFKTDNGSYVRCGSNLSIARLITISGSMDVAGQTITCRDTLSVINNSGFRFHNGINEDMASGLIVVEADALTLTGDAAEDLFINNLDFDMAAGVAGTATQYVRVINSTATGDAPIDATDDTNTDLGGNTGWNFSAAPMSRGCMKGIPF